MANEGLIDREKLTRELLTGSDNANELADTSIESPGLLSLVLEGLSSTNPRVKYKCAKILNVISQEKPEILYSYFDFFIKLLDQLEQHYQVERN